jgi:hypothetical protein
LDFDRRHSDQTEKENTMLLLVIAMAVPLFAVIGYALLSPDPPVPRELLTGDSAP